MTEEEPLRIRFTKAIIDKWDPVRVFSIPNAEYRREVMELMGVDRLFSIPGLMILHEDIDNQGNPRKLLRIPCEDAEGGYLQAVQVTCPTTYRVYHLLVPLETKTCKEAVESTWDIVGYMPIRET